MLQSFSDCVLVGVSSSIAEAHVLLNAERPDLVLLDIELEDGNAFDLLSSLPAIPFKIIFITAFNQHAIQAIKIGALDYLLKPINHEEFRLAIDKAINAPQQSEEQINIAHDYLSMPKENSRIVLKEHNIMHIVSCKDILYCNSDNGYTTFFLIDNRKIMVSGSIKEYEKLLPLSFFLRVHQSYIVNLTFVEKYNREGFLILKNAIEVPVSIRKREDVIKVLNQF
jgi:two-component system LytT family response regulator